MQRLRILHPPIGLRSFLPEFDDPGADDIGHILAAHVQSGGVIKNLVSCSALRPQCAERVVYASSGNACSDTVTGEAWRKTLNPGCVILVRWLLAVVAVPPLQVEKLSQATLKASTYIYPSSATTDNGNGNVGCC